MSATLYDVVLCLRDILEELRQHRTQRAASPAAAPASPISGGAVFPNYGRRKGEPVAGAPMGDLEYYRAGCERALADPAKAKWHGKERVLLAAIDAEIARQTGAAPAPAAGRQYGQVEWPTASGPADEDMPF